MEFRCEPCSREFETKEALDMHNNVKHPEKVKKPFFQIKDKKKIRNLIIVIAILALIIWGVYNLSKNQSYDCTTIPAKELNIGGHKNLALHIHSELSIVIDDSEQVIPAEIGILPNIMRPIHTHDYSGVLHIESPCQREFILGEFFEVWGKTFNKNCILDNCNESRILKMYVNGVENTEYENYIMHNDDKIKIDYTTKK